MYSYNNVQLSTNNVQLSINASRVSTYKAQLSTTIYKASAQYYHTINNIIPIKISYHSFLLPENTLIMELFFKTDMIPLRSRLCQYRTFVTSRENVIQLSQLLTDKLLTESRYKNENILYR